MGSVLSLMGSAKIHFFFSILVGFCHLLGEEGFIWVLSYMGRVCHIWGQQRYIWVLSNMGLGFVKYGLHRRVNLLVLPRPFRAACSFILWGLSNMGWDLSLMG